MKNASEKTRLAVMAPAGEFSDGFGFPGLSGFVQRGGVGGKFQRLNAELMAWYRVPMPRRMGNLKMRILLRHARQGHLFGDDLATRLAYRDAIAVGRAHHDAFHDGLPADQRLFAALKDGHHLGMNE